MSYLFDHLEQVRELLILSPFGLFTDLDGTISETASTPRQAQVSPTCRERLKQLVQHLPLVAVVSGRPIVEAREMMGVEGLVYIGKHGLELCLSGDIEIWPGAEAYQPNISAALKDVIEHVNIDGIYFEDKGVTASIHYRRCPEPEVARDLVLKAIAGSTAAKELRILEGRKVIDLRPPLDASKGIAVLELVRRCQLRSALYLGDDLTDVDVFVALRHGLTEQTFQGLSIGVMAAEATPLVAQEADFTVSGVAEVERFLTWLVEAIPGPNPGCPGTADRARGSDPRS